MTAGLAHLYVTSPRTISNLSRTVVRAGALCFLLVFLDCEVGSHGAQLRPTPWTHFARVHEACAVLYHALLCDGVRRCAVPCDGVRLLCCSDAVVVPTPHAPLFTSSSPEALVLMRQPNDQPNAREQENERAVPPNPRRTVPVQRSECKRALALPSPSWTPS